MKLLYKGIAVFSLLFTAAFGAAAQQLPCGTTAPGIQEEAWLRETLLKAQQRRSTTGTTEVYYIPLKIHIVRHSNGEVAIAESRALEHLAAVNKHFIGAGLQFYLKRDFNYIDLDQAFYLKWEESQILTADHKEEGVMNLFYPHSIDGPLGFAAYPPAAYAVVAGNISEPGTLIHELGHTFFLRHTHEGNDGETIYRERVDGSNCEVWGDMICDTPADPHGLPGATADCVNGYTGTIVDANGDLYAPMLENFMSYWLCQYKDQKFTEQQLQMIRLVYENYYGPTGYYPFNDRQTSVNAPSALAASFHEEYGTPSFVRLEWQDNATNETSFFIERSTSPDQGFYSVGYTSRNTGSFEDISIEAGQTYYYRVRPANSRDAFSATVRVQTAGFYCVPTAIACPSHYKIISDFSVSLGSQVVVNGNTASCSSYDFVSLPGSVLKAAYIYSLSLKIEKDHEMFMTAWVDYNRNKVFEEGEAVFSSSSARNLHTASFTVPAAVAGGLYRFRVRVGLLQRDANSPCEPNYLFGEIKDYVVSITAQAAQKITWESIGDRSLGEAPFKVSAKGVSSQPISYNVVSGPAVLEGSQLRLTDVGMVTLRASQADAQTGEIYTGDISFCVLPAKPAIWVVGATLTSSNGQGNQWYLNGQPIAGATQQTHQVMTAGVYFVETTGPCGSGVRSDAVQATVTGLEEEALSAAIRVYPNPADDRVIIEMPESFRWEKIEILDIRGRIMAEKNNAGDSRLAFSTGRLAAGVYVVRISNASHVLRKKIMIQR